MSEYWAQKRVLVTGGGGFLGRHVLEKLRDAGCQNPFVVRSREYDLTEEKNVARLFRDHPADVVVHLAGLVGGIGANKAFPADFFYQNLMMGVLTMHYAWKSGSQKFVCAGAGCGYPEHAAIPLKEEDFWNGLPQKGKCPLLPGQADVAYSVTRLLAAASVPRYCDDSWQYLWPARQF